jgi:hypothetical protein
MLTKWIPTREKVLELLEGQVNRNVSQLHVDRLVVAMLMEGWNPDISPLLFYPDGSLADGQHRLHAWLKSGCPKIHFMAGTIAREDITKVDAGRPRSTTDHAKILGIGLSSRSIAVAKMCLLLQSRSVDSSRQRSTHAQVIEACDEYEVSVWARHGIPATVTGVCAFVARRASVEKASLFHQQIEHGERLTKSDPAYHVRSMMVSMSRVGRGTDRAIQIQKTVVAWNAFWGNRELRVLRAPDMPMTWVPIMGVE